MAGTELRSGFKYVSIGVVTKDVEPNSLEAEIFLLEHMGDHSEVYEEEKKDKDKKGDDKKNIMDTLGGMMSPNAKRGATVTARWIQDGQNKMTAPTLKRGETVKVYQFGDSDQYLWKPAYYEPDVRSTEVALYTYSNIDKRDEKKRKKNFLDIIDPDSSYYMRVDTMKKKVELKTAKNDDEPAAWHFLLDTKAGYFSITDGSSIFKMGNGGISLTTGTITKNADTINMNGKSAVNVKTPAHSLKGGTSTVESALEQKGTSNFKASVKMNNNAKTIDGSKVK